MPKVIAGTANKKVFPNTPQGARDAEAYAKEVGGSVIYYEEIKEDTVGLDEIEKAVDVFRKLNEKDLRPSMKEVAEYNGIKFYEITKEKQDAKKTKVRKRSKVQKSNRKTKSKRSKKS